MKKLVLIMLLFCLAACGRQTEQEHIYILNTDVFYDNLSGVYRDNEGKPVTGRIAATVNNGEMLSEIPVKQGKKHGLQKLYSPEGAVVLESYYRENEPEGVARGYTPDGTLAKEFTYRQGRMEGPVKYYYPGGGIREEVAFHNGRYEGKYRFYSPQGDLLNESTYKNGVLHGPAFTYYPGSHLVRHTDYFKDAPVKSYCKIGSLEFPVSAEENNAPEDCVQAAQSLKNQAIRADSIYAGFKKDQTQAINHYKTKEVLIYGTISDISVELPEKTFVVSLHTPDTNVHYLSFTFPETDYAFLETLYVDRPVYILAEFDKVSKGTVYFKNPRLL